MMRRRFLKRVKTLMGLLLTAAMLCSLGITASFSASATTGSYTITINNYDEDITYTAYQIFKGDTYQATGSALYTLSNIQWGSGVNTSAVSFDSAMTNNYGSTDAATIAGKITTTADADKFAYLIGTNYLSDTGTPNSTDTITVTETGYYLIKETTDATGKEASTAYILVVVGGNITVDPKEDDSNLEKTVTSTTDANLTSASGEAATSADYSVGDTVPFTLTATLPGNYEAYDTYEMTFHDDLSIGLTFNSDSVVVTVYVDSADLTGTVVGSSYYSVATSPADSCDFHVAITDTNSLKGRDGDDITVTKDSIIKVTYNATVNSSAFSTNTETNKSYLEYSKNGGTDGKGTTTTQVTTLIDLTLTITKTKADGSTALSGAGFTLYQLVYFDAADAKISYESDKFYYYDDTTKTWKVDDNRKATNGRAYYKVFATPTVSSAGDNVFTFNGLSAGEYYLVESTTPGGYNTMEDLYFKVEVTTEETTSGDPNTVTVKSVTITNASGETISGASIENKTFTVDTSDASITSTIVNTSGSNMPGSGGIGTTIFYVVGGVLMVGAGVLLVVRRRMRGSKRSA